MIPKTGPKSFEVKRFTDEPQRKQTTRTPAERFGNEFSSGRGSALRAKALSVTGATALAGVVLPKGPLSPSQSVVPEVGVMQDRLIKLGYLDQEILGSYRGVYGNNTKAAVAVFQLANGLEPTGLADERTERK